MAMMRDPYARAQGPTVGRRGVPGGMYGPLVTPEEPVTPQRPVAVVPRPVNRTDPWGMADVPGPAGGMMLAGGPQERGVNARSPVVYGGLAPSMSARPSPVSPAGAGAGGGNPMLSLDAQYNAALAAGDVASANRIWLEMVALNDRQTQAQYGQVRNPGSPAGGVASLTSSGLGFLG